MINALGLASAVFTASDGLPAIRVRTDEEVAELVLNNFDVVLAAAIESGWRPTDEQLRAMGG